MYLFLLTLQRLKRTFLTGQRINFKMEWILGYPLHREVLKFHEFYEYNNLITISLYLFIHNRG